MRITNNNIGKLYQNEIFVFGSNEAGLHIGGAALHAYLNFGARYGQGFGQAGKSFAIPTLDWHVGKLPLGVIRSYVRRFIKFARYNKNLTFLVTEIGCGIAGRTPEEIAPLFKGAKRTKNIHLPQRFWDILNT